MEAKIKIILLLILSAMLLTSGIKTARSIPYCSISSELIAAPDKSFGSIYEAPQWALVADDVTATVYNAVKKQCNSTPSVTASLYQINMKDVLSDRIIAMERTMMAEYGIHYGDRVLVAGAGRWNGVWQVQDTMNKRFAGKHKIDFLVPKHIRHGKWQNVEIYTAANDAAREYLSKQF